MNLLQKTMPEKKLQQNTNTTEHHEYVTENHARENFATEHHEYITENQPREDFSTEHNATEHHAWPDTNLITLLLVQPASSSTGQHNDN